MYNNLATVSKGGGSMGTVLLLPEAWGRFFCFQNLCPMLAFTRIVLT